MLGFAAPSMKTHIPTSRLQLADKRRAYSIYHSIQAPVITLSLTDFPKPASGLDDFALHDFVCPTGSDKIIKSWLFSKAPQTPGV